MAKTIPFQTYKVSYLKYILSDVDYTSGEIMARWTKDIYQEDKRHETNPF